MTPDTTPVFFSSKPLGCTSVGEKGQRFANKVPIMILSVQLRVPMGLLHRLCKCITTSRSVVCIISHMGGFAAIGWKKWIINDCVFWSGGVGVNIGSKKATGFPSITFGSSQGLGGWGCFIFASRRQNCQSKETIRRFEIL